MLIFLICWFNMNCIDFAIKAVGGGSKAAQICQVSDMAISKWRKKGKLPRTEYTGETNYAKLLSEKSNGQFTAEWLLENASPNKQAA